MTVDEFRIGVAETYDVIVEPTAEMYTIFAQSEDRTGFARGTLATSIGIAAPIPPMDPRPVRSMTDMGMGGHGRMSGMGGMETHKTCRKTAPQPQPAATWRAWMTWPQANHGQAEPSEALTSGMAGMNGMDMSGGGGMAGMDMSSAGKASRTRLRWRGIAVDNVAMAPDRTGLARPGDGLRRQRTARADLPRPARHPPGCRPSAAFARDHAAPDRQHASRYMWGFDGKKFSQAEPIRLALGERVRFTLINDTMMEHPIHLHGLWSELENGQDEYRPYKHTVIVQPGGKLSYLVTADSAGMWAFHCHLLYHMEMGMMRTVLVA